MRAATRQKGAWGGGRLLLRLLWLAALLLSTIPLASGSISHAMEPARCVDVPEAVELGHAIGDADQVPADNEKSYPHHHGGCHGHQLLEVWPAAALIPDVRMGSKGAVSTITFRKATAYGPTLRPPIA